MMDAIAASASVTEVFRALFLYATRISPADGIFVAAYAPETGLRRCVYSGSLVPDDAGDPRLEEFDDLSVFPDVPLNTGPQSRAIVTNDVVNTPDLDAAVVGLPRVDVGSDFEARPPRSSLAVPFGVEGRVLGAFEVQSTQLAAFDDRHVRPLKMAAKLAAIAVENLDLVAQQRAQNEATLRALGVALEYRDYETKGHTDRVVALSFAFGQALSLDDDQLQNLRWGAYLHDLGKVAMPDPILLKPGRLTSEEFAVIQRHTLIGIDMCQDIPFLPAGAREIVRSHHERWDGGGYPDGLAGEAIPLLARIFALVDVYDALTSERPYKAAWTREAALDEMEGQAGRQFDPHLAPPFFDIARAQERPRPRSGGAGG